MKNNMAGNTPPDSKKKGLLLSYHGKPDLPAASTQGVPGREIRNEHQAVGMHKITIEEYLWETSKKERAALRAELCQAVLHFIGLGLPVYLENFGILIPRIVSKNVTHIFNRDVNLREEKFRTISFEKCDDLTSYNRERFKKVIETKELADKVHPRLPLFININWTVSDTKRFIKGLLLLLRSETVIAGHSQMLEPVGVFYSLHNRQGKKPEDWFAGSDILLRPVFEQIVQVGRSRVFKRPVFKNAWEPLTAAYGNPCSQFKIDLETELQHLGYDTSQLEDFLDQNQKSINVAVFSKAAGRKENPSGLIYCTDGLRNLAYKDNFKNSKTPQPLIGTEFVFQLDQSPQDKANNQNLEIPLWPARPLTIAWILLQSSKNGGLPPGIGLSCDTPLIDDTDTILDTILLTEFNPLNSAVLCTQGSYSYLNVVGITAEEAAVAKDHSFEHLNTLLKHKGLDQTTKLSRSSVLAKTKLDFKKSRSQIRKSRRQYWEKLVWSCQ
jgi:hypothetical protein